MGRKGVGRVKETGKILLKNLKSGKKMKILLGAIGILAAVSLGIGVYRGQRISVETAVAVRQNVEDFYTEEGTLSFGSEFRVTSQVSGPVLEILVKENDRVEEGTVLFTIDSKDYEYEKTLAESVLAGYEAQLELSRINQVMTTSPQEYLSTVQQELAARESDYQAAKSVYEADQILFSSGFISKVQIEADKAAYESAMTAWQQAKGRYEESSRFLEELKEEGIDQSTINSRFYGSEEKQLKAQVQSQKTQIQQLSDNIEKCQVKAPKAGIITSIPAEGMSVIQAGETGATMKSREKLTAEADVLTNIAPYIQTGDSVKIVLKMRGKDMTYEGCVSQVYDYASEGVSSLGLEEYRVHVKADVAETEELEGKEGYGIHMTFCLYRGEDCLTVPSSAVFQDENQYFVYQIRMGKAIKTAVEVEYQTGNQAVIASGLEAGDQVIDQVDSAGIYEGARVRT